MRGDGRSCRVAVVPDTVLNPPPGAPDRLTELADAGWGVMALGPPGAGELWLDAIVDQVVTFLGDDYEVILDGPETPEVERFVEALAATGHTIPRGA